ncbi:protocatechuate 3,4-dioxygenase subunit alpha [Nocardia sp. NPDC004123]
MSDLTSTPSQTVGPYLDIGLTWPDGPYAVPEGTPGAVWIRGRVFDGAGDPIDDALIETWQADETGHFTHQHEHGGESRGYARSHTRGGEFAVHTLVPGALSDGQAPHIDVSVLARGLLHRVVTRIYFPEHSEMNRDDPVLISVPAHRRDTLVATRTGDGYRFDIHLQGELETVFFDV